MITTVQLSWNTEGLLSTGLVHRERFSRSSLLATRIVFLHLLRNSSTDVILLLANGCLSHLS